MQVSRVDWWDGFYEQRPEAPEWFVEEDVALKYLREAGIAYARNILQVSTLLYFITHTHIHLRRPH